MNIKKLIGVVICGTALCINSIPMVSNAKSFSNVELVSCDEKIEGNVIIYAAHEHAYSNMGRVTTERYLGSHTFQKNYNGSMINATCNITYVTSGDKMECACGAFYYANQFSSTHHSACGL